MPCFLKSWNTYSKDLSESQALAFLTVSQLGIPYRVIWGCFMGEMMPDLLPRRQSEVYAHHTPHIGRLAPSLRADSPGRHRYGLGACPRGCAPNGVEVQLSSHHC